MKNKSTIAGLSITANFCQKINEVPIKSAFISTEPLVTIYTSGKQDTYTVNIVAHIPTQLKTLEETNLGSGLFLDEGKTMFLNYNGVSYISTSVNKPATDGVLLSRSFDIEYNSDETIVEEYNMYQIQFDYKLLTKNTQSVEAIIVQLKNEDPETDRGTVTAVRTDDR